MISNMEFRTVIGCWHGHLVHQDKNVSIDMCRKIRNCLKAWMKFLIKLSRFAFLNCEWSVKTQTLSAKLSIVFGMACTDKVILNVHVPMSWNVGYIARIITHTDKSELEWMIYKSAIPCDCFYSNAMFIVKKSECSPIQIENIIQLKLSIPFMFSKNVFAFFRK